MSDRFLKIAAWSYVIALVALTFAHLNLQAEIGNPFNVYRILALCFAGMLARVAYPMAPSGVCLMMIAGVFGLGVAHYVSVGSYGSPMNTILDMASSLWGVVLGAAAGRLRLFMDGKRELPQ